VRLRNGTVGGEHREYCAFAAVRRHPEEGVGNSAGIQTARDDLRWSIRQISPHR
jgi:hypothetical protein